MIEETEKNKEKIINCGSLGYSNSQIAILFEVDETGIDKLMNDKSSWFCQTYNKGKVIFDYVIDTKLMDLARNGDIKALDKLERRKTIRKQGE